MSLLQAWKKQVVQSPVVRVMRIYWKVFIMKNILQLAIGGSE